MNPDLPARLRLALRILPTAHRARYQEEWAADLLACQGEGIPQRQIEQGALRLALARRARHSWRHTRARRIAATVTGLVLAGLVLAEWVDSRGVALLSLLALVGTLAVLGPALRRRDGVLLGCATVVLLCGGLHVGLAVWWGGHDLGAALLPGGGWDLTRGPFDVAQLAHYHWWSLLGAPFSPATLVPWAELGSLRGEPGTGPMFAAAVTGWAALFVGWAAFLTGLARWFHVKPKARTAWSR